MNGVHDMGGMHGFGAVEREENEPPFHAPWERTVRGMNRVIGSRLGSNIDAGRHRIERMPPDRYLAASYYERWLAALETLVFEQGAVTSEALDARTEYFLANPDAAPPPPAAAADPTAFPDPPPTAEHPYRRDGTAPPRFAVGDRVVTRNMQPVGHTRLPRYARGKHGVIDLYHGVFVFPDTNAHGLGEAPQPLYSVRFTARELWGEPAEPNQSVNIDLWESYLLPDGTMNEER